MINRILRIGSLFLLLLLTANCSSESKDLKNEKIYEDSSPSLSQDLADAGSSSAELASANSSVSNSRQNAITKAVQQCSPAIVGINVTETVQVEYRDPFFDHPFFREFFGRRAPRYRQYQVEGLGSGFIISPDGYILTNHHVAGKATEVIVTMTNGKEYEAEIIGSDIVSDVALLKIDGENLPYLKFADSQSAIIGEWVIAFGNPFGLFDINAKPTVTVGVISNIGIDFFQEKRVYKGMIQTDAAISSGNSGGPLVNSLGEVIGMNTVIFSTAQSREGAGSIGIGFAIPINRVKKIIDILKDEGEVKRNYYIGMKVQNINEKIARYFGLGDKTDGVIVVSMDRESPAFKAGIEPGDVITEVNGRPIITEQDYYIAVFDNFVGDTINFKIRRDDDIISKKFKLKEFD